MRQSHRASHTHPNRLAGAPLHNPVPASLRALLNAEPTAAENWAVLLDWCLLHADPWAQPLRDAVRWADALTWDAFGLRAQVTVDDHALAFRWVPGGGFEMGAPPGEPGRTRREHPHPVTLSRGCWLGEDPVTTGLWHHVMGIRSMRDPQLPATGFNASEVAAFVAALSLQVSRLMPRLPTEAEWESACRAGSSEATWAGPLVVESAYRASPLDDMAWYGGTSDFSGPRPCGLGVANPLGIRDMLGNIWEWCSDWSGEYAASVTVDPIGPPTGHERICRGGSWRSFAREVRAAYRGRAGLRSRRDDLGLRLAQSPRLRF